MEGSNNGVSSVACEARGWAVVGRFTGQQGTLHGADGSPRPPQTFLPGLTLTPTNSKLVFSFFYGYYTICLHIHHTI